jgi:acyl-homoserine lactone synthase
MFAVHIIDRTNRDLYEEQIEQHFRIRHEIYVGERGWYDLARADGREIDAFDTEDATYLLGITSSGEMVAGSRLVPTLKPHLMSEIFPSLAPAGILRAPDIFEWTRIFVVPALRMKGQPCQAAGWIYCGIVEFCLMNEVRRLSVVCEPYWNRRLEKLGWNPEPLGPPISHRGEPIIGLALDMTRSALETTRRQYRISGSVLRTRNAELLSHQKINQRHPMA